MFQKIFTFLSLSLVLVGGFFVNFDGNTLWWISIWVEAYAATWAATDVEMQKMIDKGIAFMNGSLEVLTVIVSPAIFLASWLMTPDWTSGDIFGLRPVLHDLWILVSNVTYFIYALLLIFIALATIFNSQNYGYKKLLPRLALGIILVPLTWWFVQFIISLATIVTASVMNLPMEVVQNNANKQNKIDVWWWDDTIHQKYQFFTDDFDKVLLWGAAQEKKCGQWATCVSPKSVLTDASWMYSALIIYGHGVFKIGEAKNLKTNIDVAKTWMSILNQLILWAIMFIVFGFLVIALVFLLFMRAIKLWFYAIFSPLMTLRYVIGDGFFGKDNSDGFDVKEFIGLAFVPALVWLALSFGLMMITILQNAWWSGPWNTIQCDGNKIATTGCPIWSIAWNPKNTIISKAVDPANGGQCIGQLCLSLTVLKFGWIDFEFYGGIVGRDEAAKNAADTRGTLSGLGWMFGVLIIDMIALIFIWTAFMAAKNVSKVAQAVIKPFEDMGRKVWGFAKDLPKYTPIPGTGWLSLKGGEKLVNSAERAIETKHEEAFKDTKYGKMFGADRYMSDDQSDKLAKAIKSKDYAAVSDITRANSNKAEWYRWSHVQALAEELRWKKPDEQGEILKKLQFKDDDSKKILEFMTTSKSNLKSEEDKKELWELMKSAVGAPSSGKWGNNSSAWYTAWISNDDKWINLNIKNSDSTVNANIKIENLNDPEKIASAIKGNAVIQESMKGILTAEEWDSLLKNRITDPEKRKKVIEWLWDIVKSQPNIPPTAPDPTVR